MEIKKIIPCLDICNGRVVKGVKFVGLIDAADPVEAAKVYSKNMADELVLLDITATYEERDTIVELVSKVAKEISIPLSVGGGIRTIEDFKKIINAGANKVAVNSAAVNRPNLINEAAKEFGCKSVIAAIDAKFNKVRNSWDVYINGGRINAGIDVIDWAIEAENRGAGEILLTSMDRDGTKIGYDIDLTKKVSEAVNIPVIASGGAGNMKDFLDVLTIGRASAALAASLFHFKEVDIKELKKYLKERNVQVLL